MLRQRNGRKRQAQKKKPRSKRTLVLTGDDWARESTDGEERQNNGGYDWGLHDG
jgi:hypothetical protein